MRLEIYRRKFAIFSDWFDRRWGQGKYNTGNRADFPKDIPFPRARMKAAKRIIEAKYAAKANGEKA